MEQVEGVEQKMSKNSSTSSKNVATELTIGAALAAELMVGFWFAVGAILTIKMVNSLEELINRK